jgi:hypothetical protein
MGKDKDSILLTIIFIYGAAEAEKVHQKVGSLFNRHPDISKFQDDPFTVQKERLGALEVKYGSQENRPKVIPWMSIKTDIPSQVRNSKYQVCHVFVFSAENLGRDCSN